MSRERTNHPPTAAGTRLLVCLALALGFAPSLAAQSVPCGGSRIDYVQAGDDGLDPNTCPGGNTCVTPEVSGPTYTFEAGCNPYTASCAGTAVLDVHFPGNHHNPFNSFYSYATLELYSSGGSLVGTCGVPGATITQDFGTATVTGDAACFDPGAGVFELHVISCKNLSGCEEITTVGLDFAAAAGCEPPPMERCGTGDASCEDCLPGGLGVGGSPPGFGGPGDAKTGPGATLRHTAGGVGHPNLPGSEEWNETLGRSWSHDYAQRLVPSADESQVYLLTEFGTFRLWENPDGSGVYQDVAPSNEDRTLTRTAGGFQITELDGTVHAFDSAGLWLSTTDRNGNTTIASYSSGVLSAVDFPGGRREEFSYHPIGDPAEGKLATITEVGVDGTSIRVWSYTWSGDDLVRIDRPDGTALVFTYGDPGLPGYLTRVELEGDDGSSTRVLRAWELNAEGDAVASWRGDGAKAGPNAVDVWELAFDDPAEPSVTTVTDPLGQEITYQLGRDTVSDNVKVTSIAGDCPVCGLGPNATLAYDDADHPLLPTSRTNGRGFTTVTSYDANGRITSRTEAMGEAEGRTTTWTYDATYPALVTSREVPSVAGGGAFRTTEWVRDGSGNATTRRITGVEAGSAFSYDTESTFNAAGRPLSVDPPGHGTDDVTSFTYDSARGDLVADSRTDPLVGATVFAHDPFHRRISVTDPNGVVTETDYDALDRVTAIRRAAGTSEELVTTHEHTTFGDLLRTTLPEGNVIEYGYDPAGRLVSIERKPDATTPGERTVYTLDAAGNRIREELQRWDAGAGAWVTASETAFEYSSRCQVDRVIEAPGKPEQAVTESGYDCNGNLERLWDPNHPRFPEDPSAPPPPPDADGASLVLRTHEEAPAPIVYAYDALDRLTEVDALWGGEGGGTAVTRYAYDVQDHLVSVTDAEGNVTRSTYSDRDLLTEEVSPVSGTTTHTYDEHGELLTTTDARGVTVTRTVDALDRVTAVSYPDPSLDVSYLYDQAPAACAEDFHAGRLAEILRDGSSVVSCYDRLGRVTRDGELTYGYDGNGNRTTVGYPGSVVATYGYDFADRQASLTLQVGAEPAQTIVSAAGYLPSGPLASLALGNGLSETRSYDGRYALAGIDLPGITELTYTTDPVGNVTRIERSVLASSLVLGYRYQDIQYFLSEGAGPWGRRSWSYDRIGNRLTEARRAGGDVDPGSAEGVYTYATNAAGGNTPQLLEVAGPLGAAGPDRDESLLHAVSYDAAGNQTSIEPIPSGFGEGSSLLGYDDASRLVSLGTVFGSEETTITYDGRGYPAVSELTVFRSSDFERTEAVYGSEGLLRAVHRTGERTGSGDGDADDGGGGAGASSFDETTYLLDFAGRPVAQLTVDERGSAPDRLLWLTPDHLGTPIAATDASGAAVWQGGLSPFGTPYSFTEDGVAGGDQDPADGGSDVDDPNEPLVEPPPDPPPPGDDGRDDGLDGGGGGGPPCEEPDCDDGRDDGLDGGGGGGTPCEGPDCDDGREQPPGSGDDGRDLGGGTGGGEGEPCTGPDCDDGRDGGGGGGTGGDPCTTDCADGRSATLGPRATLTASPEEAGILLRFPGQWHDPTFETARIPGGLYQNVHRWYSPGVGRYTRVDPLGLAGDLHPYLYTSANPLAFVDPLGQRSRVCCTPITEGGLLAAFKHCFIETEDDTSGVSTTRAVHRVRGKGCKYENDSFDTRRVGDTRTDCGPWDEGCDTDECVAQEFGNYPNPSDYQLIRGPNSNSFASTVTDACGLTAPAIAGTNQTPGWGDQGRPAKDERFQCPEKR